MSQTRPDAPDGCGTYPKVRAAPGRGGPAPCLERHPVRANCRSTVYARRVSDVTITVRANGPYKIVGPVRIVDPAGGEFELPAGDAIVLCRCGHSRTKPFCDATHRRIGFESDDVAPRVDADRPAG